VNKSKARRAAKAQARAEHLGDPEERRSREVLHWLANVSRPPRRSRRTEAYQLQQQLDADKAEVAQARSHNLAQLVREQ
jgi:hypothetical protein